MENRIYEKLGEISELDDRKLLKKIMKSVFSALEEYSKDRFDDLEKRVFDEAENYKEKYNIYCTIVERERIDPIDSFMNPILIEDIEETLYDTEEIINLINEKKEKNMLKVFFKCDYSIFNEIISNNPIVKGRIETDLKVHEAYFRLEKNKDYLKKIEELYKSFINNNIPWTTINNPYIHKIANVILTGCDEINPKEKIEKITIDFGEYSKYVEYDMIPHWNVKQLSLKCSGFPMPCEDKVNYEHSISIVKEGTSNGYLLNHDSTEINYVRFNKDSIVISSSISEIQSWNVWKIKSGSESRKNKFEYEIMSNEVSVNFANKLALEKRYTIKTKTELARVINSFKASEYLEFKDVKLEDKNHNKEQETYDVNDFIIDEIREADIKRTMVLYFQPVVKENYLNRDILSFLVSEVQLIYPEYQCEGRLI